MYKIKKTLISLHFDAKVTIYKFNLMQCCSQGTQHSWQSNNFRKKLQISNSSSHNNTDETRQFMLHANMMPLSKSIVYTPGFAHVLTFWIQDIKFGRHSESSVYCIYRAISSTSMPRCGEWIVGDEDVSLNPRMLSCNPWAASLLLLNTTTQQRTSFMVVAWHSGSVIGLDQRS